MGEGRSEGSRCWCPGVNGPTGEEVERELVGGSDQEAGRFTVLAERWAGSGRVESEGFGAGE